MMGKTVFYSANDTLDETIIYLVVETRQQFCSITNPHRLLNMKGMCNIYNYVLLDRVHTDGSVCSTSQSEYSLTCRNLFTFFFYGQGKCHIDNGNTCTSYMGQEMCGLF